MSAQASANGHAPLPSHEQPAKRPRTEQQSASEVCVFTHDFMGVRLTAATGLELSCPGVADTAGHRSRVLSQWSSSILQHQHASPCTLCLRLPIRSCGHHSRHGQRAAIKSSCLRRTPLQLDLCPYSPCSWPHEQVRRCTQVSGSGNPLQRHLLEHPDVACYICELPDIVGKFDPGKAKSLGIPKGPQYGQLQRGQPVTTPAGRSVSPSEVKHLLCVLSWPQPVGYCLNWTAACALHPAWHDGLPVPPAAVP